MQNIMSLPRNTIMDLNNVMHESSFNLITTMMGVVVEG